MGGSLVPGRIVWCCSVKIPHPPRSPAPVNLLYIFLFTHPFRLSIIICHTVKTSVSLSCRHIQVLYKTEMKIMAKWSGSSQVQVKEIIPVVQDM